MGESYGKWLYTRDIIGLQCKGMPKILQRNVKNAKVEEMKYTLAINVFIQLGSISIPQLGVGFYRTYKPPSKGCTWILVATELFTKWVEVVAMKKAIRSSVANFLRENIICHFRYPTKLF